MPADAGSLTILGPNSLTANQIQAWCAADGKGNGRLNCTLGQLIGWYVSEGAAQGVRGDVAFAQACLETGWFTSADTALNNFAGIGHPVGAPSGLDFPSPQTGVRAQIQLLAKVTGESTFAYPDVAPDWLGGNSSTWGGLHAAGWAADPNYGQSIISVYNSILGGNPVLNTSADGSTVVADPAQAGGTTYNPGGGVASLNSASHVAPGFLPAIDPKWQASPQVTAATFKWPTGAKTSGLPAAAALAAAVTTDSTVDLSSSQLGEIQLTLADPDGTLTGGFPGLLLQDSGDVGPYLQWGTDVLVVGECQTIDTDMVPCMILTFRTGCLQWMATRRVNKVWDGVSATQWLELVISEYNGQLPPGVPEATFLGQTTAAYAGGIMANASLPVTQWQSYYDIAQQLCSDEGMWLFESGGVVVFGKPTWLATVAPTVKIGYQNSKAYPMDPDAVTALNYPRCLRSVSVFTGDTLEVDLPRNLGEQLRPGHLLELSGVPYFSAKQWIVTGVQFSYDGGATPVTVQANEAKDPVAASPGGVAPSPPQTDPTGHPPQGTSLQFVQFAETQLGVPYLYGGSSPSTGFDCSGLVQWALGQLGISFPRTSGDQYTACAAVPGANKGVDLAATIYGALLFKDTASGAVAGEHVAISLGQTRNTTGTIEVLVFQAPHTGADVGTAWVPTSYFNEGAIIPELNYGTNGTGN